VLSIKECHEDLKKLGNDYFISELKYVQDIQQWAAENQNGLTEPHLPMKLVTEDNDNLSMIVQSEVPEENIDDVIRNLSLRWSVRDNTADLVKRLNSVKKRLAYCFLKEYARTLQKVDGEEISEDEWVLEEMDYLGYFNE